MSDSPKVLKGPRQQVTGNRTSDKKKERYEDLHRRFDVNTIIAEDIPLSQRLILEHHDKAGVTAPDYRAGIRKGKGGEWFDRPGLPH